MLPFQDTKLSPKERAHDLCARQPVEKPRVGCYCLQTALRWFAGEVLQHKG